MFLPVPLCDPSSGYSMDANWMATMNRQTFTTFPCRCARRRQERTRDYATLTEGEAMADEVWLTTDQVVRATGLSMSTVRRRLRTRSFPGARRRSPGSCTSEWEVPLSALVRLGLCNGLEPSADDFKVRIQELEAKLALLEEKNAFLEEHANRQASLCEQQALALARLSVSAVEHA